jgi:hypothetical protein
VGVPGSLVVSETQHRFRAGCKAPPAAEARSVRRHEIEQTETFSLLAELALGLAGFTGIAGAFGGRDRSYSTAERIRLLSIFLAAGGALAGSLCVLTFASAGGSETSAYIWASLIAATVLLAQLSGIPASYRLAIDPHASTSMPVLAFALAYLLVCLGLLGANLVVWREAWPLAAAFSLQLTFGVFLFARILIQRN